MRDAPKAEQHKGRDPKIDLGLAVIAAVTAQHCPGYCWTRDEIADVCDVNVNAIKWTEKRALRSLRAALQSAGIRSLSDIL